MATLAAMTPLLPSPATARREAEHEEAVEGKLHAERPDAEGVWRGDSRTLLVNWLLRCRQLRGEHECDQRNHGERQENRSWPPQLGHDCFATTSIQCSARKAARAEPAAGRIRHHPPHLSEAARTAMRRCGWA